MSVTAGALDRRITFERYTSVADALNEEVKTWAALATRWARREDVSDGERIAAGELGAYQVSRFVVRSDDVTRTINPKDRISYSGSLWNIQSAKETSHGRRAFIEVRAVRAAD